MATIGVRVGERDIMLTPPPVPPVKCSVNKGVVSYAVQFPDRGFLSDSRGEVRCLQAIAGQLASVGGIDSVLETSSRVGITVPVWEEDLRPKNIMLNDLNSHLARQLARNFPEVKVFSKDIQSWAWPRTDLVYADMNTFTLKKLDAWRFIFRKAAEEAQAKWLVFVDSCCFGFKFGKTASYLAYGPTSDYYWTVLRNSLQEEFGWTVRFGSRYDRAALLAADRTGETSEILWLPPGDKRVDLINSIPGGRGFF